MSVLTSVVITLSCLGAQPSPSNYEHMKGVEWIVGTFTCDAVSTEEIPGAVAKGDKFTLKAVFEWTLNKNAIAYEIVLSAKGKDIVRYQGLMGWNATDKQIVSGGFDSLGGSGLAVWTKEGAVWKAMTTGADPDGVKTTGTLVMSDISENGFTAQGKAGKRGDADRPDGPIAIYKRVK